ncbi:DUF1302 domain-containing protein [bacterium]|nr:DUF1302 domain-containing protein [bacterium]
MLRRPFLRPLLAASFCLPAFGAHAINLSFDWGRVVINTSVEAGFQWRMQDRASDLVGKSNLNPSLCETSSCQGHTIAPGELGLIGEGPAVNQQAVDAPGQFSNNFDDGNLNFDKYDLTQALAKAAQDITVDFDFMGERWTFFTRYYAHYDVENYNRDEFHPNVITPQTIADNGGNRRLGVGDPTFIARNDAKQEQVGLNFRLLDFSLKGRLPFFGDRSLDFTVGRHLINWGESTYLAVNSLNTFSAPSLIAFQRPAFLNIEETFVPTGALSLKTDLTYDIGVSAWYGYEWLPAEIYPPGSFLSFVDVGTDNTTDHLNIGFGKVAEDPDGLAFGNQSLLSALTDTSLTARLLPENEASDGGQFGLGLSMYLPNLFTGTEMNFYYARYHSRLPYISAYAGDTGCFQNAVPTGNEVTDTQALLNQCPGLDLNVVIQAAASGGTARPEQNIMGGTEPGVGGNAFPLDSIAFQLDYPEDIDLFGFSFNTAFGDVSIQGELAYRPNLPLQVATPDLGFAALQTPFPGGCSNPGSGCEPGTEADHFNIALTPQIPLLAQLGVDTAVSLADIPGQAQGVPQFVLSYRGIDPVTDLQPGDYIPGFERFKVMNYILGATYIIGPNNPLGADQIILLGEIGGTQILDLPPLDQLQIEAAGVFTSASAGADGSGADGSPQSRSGLVGPSGSRFNPEQADLDAFVDEFAWGTRLIAILRYDSVFPGISFEPVLLILNDWQGTGPGPGENFIEGRQQYQANVEMRVGNAISYTAGYAWFTGAGENNLLRDRDFAQFGVRYRF